MKKTPKKTVLLVANGDLRQSANEKCWPAQAAMEQQGYRPTVRLDPQLALEWVAQTQPPPDVALIDFLMPRMAASRRLFGAIVWKFDTRFMPIQASHQTASATRTTRNC